MSHQPFHHGNLRATLLAEADQVIRDDGAEALSLRELARRAGVSHGAPRRHFPDRQALLDAVAEQGFDRLTEAMHSELRTDSLDDAARFRAAATTYVRFAIDEAALLELMFASKNGGGPPSLHAAANRFFGVVAHVLSSEPSGRTSKYGQDRQQLLVVATLQGIATLVASGRVSETAVDDLIEEAAHLFTSR